MVLQGEKKSNVIKKTEQNFGCFHYYKAQVEKNQISNFASYLNSKLK